MIVDGVCRKPEETASQSSTLGELKEMAVELRGRKEEEELSDKRASSPSPSDGELVCVLAVTIHLYICTIRTHTAYYTCIYLFIYLFCCNLCVRVCSFLCSDSLLYTSFFFFLFYMVFIHVIVHVYVQYICSVCTYSSYDGYLVV